MVMVEVAVELSHQWLGLDGALWAWDTITKLVAAYTSQK